MGFTHIGDWVGRGVSDDFREEFRHGNPELPLVTREVLCANNNDVIAGVMNAYITLPV